ncbi:MAG: DEAD/DEAH box helicase [Oligoflexales bacterium]
MSFLSRNKKGRKSSTKKKRSRFFDDSKHNKSNNKTERKRKFEGKKNWQSDRTNDPQLDNKTFEKAVHETHYKIEQWQDEGRAAQEQSQDVKPFHLDPWQDDAVQALLAGANVIVDAPTTAGKTRVVEAYIEAHINDAGFRACYTCPVKSLSNDKLREFREKYGKESIGIATGDIKENLDAPVVIATLESYRNSLLGVEPDLDRSLVIFDEYHFLQDGSRGSAWEEAIILTPFESQILMLSASLSNAGEFAEWLEYLTKRPSVLVEVSKRPVPLANLVWFQGEWVLAESLPKKVLPKKRGNYLEPLTHEEISPRLAQLIPLKLTPCIVYSGKRLSCELLAGTIARSLPPLDRDSREKIGAILLTADKEYQALSFLKPSLRKMIQVYGVAYHHSGLAPLARLLIESLVKQGVMRFCTATMGLSLGINFSVKSTVISDAVRPGESGFTPYSSSEVLQMTGRAGRRGKDVVGFSCWLNINYYNRFGQTNRDRCESRLRNDPITFLGLVSRSFSLGKIEQFYRKSFLNFRTSDKSAKLIRANRVEKTLNAHPIPCQSPASEYVLYHSEQNSICYDCKLRKNCHRFIADSTSNISLASLQLHLHYIGALNNVDTLNPLGEIARYFPQSGGFVIANMVLQGEINTNNLIEAAQLMGAFSLARFKSPNVPMSYRFPFKTEPTEKDINFFYPSFLFPELYETMKGQRKSAPQVFKEFNPLGGYIVDLWTQGCEWNDLLTSCSNAQFGAGDITGLLYRTASYLQSLSQGGQGELSFAARDLRESILKSPLQIVL